MTQDFRRKKIWLVNRDFQFRYTGAGLVAGVMSTFITALLLLYPLFAFKIITVGIFLPWPILLCIVTAACLNCSVQMMFGIVLTHKIAGPMFSLTRHLRLIGAGHWNVQMRQRSGDEFRMVIRHLNEMTLSLKNCALDDLAVLELIKTQISSFDLQPKQSEEVLILIGDLMSKVNKRIQERREEQA
jgi:methyl-accepting chemotaxis protein